jgi:SAM-dependent methyltransferase
VEEQLSSKDLLPYYEAQRFDQLVYANEENVKNLKFYYGALVQDIHKRFSVGRILDVGCSAGYFLDLMREKGWECHGIEMDARYARMAQERHGASIFAGTLEGYQDVKEGYFDVISMQDVLDHLADPVAGLRRCFRMLKPGGMLIVKVHDVGSVYARLTGPKYYGFLPPLHLVYFNRDNVRRALVRSGFVVDGHRYFPHILFLRTALYWMLPQKKGMVYSLVKKIADSWVGKIRIRKNFFDVVTVFAHRPLAET